MEKQINEACSVHSTLMKEFVLLFWPTKDIKNSILVLKYLDKTAVKWKIHQTASNTKSIQTNLSQPCIVTLKDENQNQQHRPCTQLITYMYLHTQDNYIYTCIICTCISKLLVHIYIHSVAKMTLKYFSHLHYFEYIQVQWTPLQEQTNVQLFVILCTTSSVLHKPHLFR